MKNEMMLKKEGRKTSDLVNAIDICLNSRIRDKSHLIPSLNDAMT